MNNQNSKQLTKVSENTMEGILSRVGEMEQNGLKLPPNYSPDNAVRSAWLILQETQTINKKPVLEECTKVSIANAILKMVVNGLNPQKKQCYFIPYGNKLECMTSYFGNIAIGKRAGLKDVKAMLIRKGDVFNYEIDSKGRMKVTAHEQSFENLDAEIVGAYAVIEHPDGTIDTDVMTIEQIKQSWKQGATKGASPAHRNFEAEMCKRTVTNRAIKVFVNSSDDSALGFDDEDEPKQTQTEAYVNHEIKTKANKKQIGFDEEVEAEEVPHEEEEAEEMPEFEETAQATMDGPGF